MLAIVVNNALMIDLNIGNQFITLKIESCQFFSTYNSLYIDITLNGVINDSVG